MQIQDRYNTYETVIIVGAENHSQEQSDEILNNFKKLLTDNASKIIHVDKWGLKKLAYKIKNNVEGYYYILEYQSPRKNIPMYETELKRNESIIRFLTISLDKYAIKYNETKRLKKETATSNN